MKKYILFILIYAIHFHVGGQTVSNLGSLSGNSMNVISGGLSTTGGLQFPRKNTIWSNSKWQLGNAWFDSAGYRKIFYWDGLVNRVVADTAWVDSVIKAGGTVAGVASFNGRQGVVTLTFSDVRTALGYVAEDIANKVTSTGSPNTTTYYNTLGVNNLINTNLAGFFARSDSNTAKNPITFTYAQSNYYPLTGNPSNFLTVVSTLPNGVTMQGYLKTTAIADPSTPPPATGYMYQDLTHRVLNFKNEAGVLSNTAIPITSVTHQWLNSFASDGTFTQSQPAFTDISGTALVAQGGTGATTTTSVNGTPITYGANNTLSVGTGTVTNVIGGTNITITGTSTIQPTVNLSGTIAVANGGTGTTATTSVNTTPITYGTNNTITAAPSGTASGDLTGTYPSPTLATVNASPATYGSATAIPVITVDSKGRATTITTVNPSVTATNTATLTNKRWTARVSTTTTVSATPAFNTDNYDIFEVTAQTVDITNVTTNLSGTPVNGDIVEFRITGTAARAITWGTSFVSTTVTLPTTTTTTATLTVIFQYYSTGSYGSNKWYCLNYF